MNPKVNYVLVGLFVLVMGVAIILTTLWLVTKGQAGNFQTFIAYTRESVAGLNPNAPVKYRGVDVGQVRSISLDPDNPERVRLLLDITEGVPVKQDTVAVIASRGFITGLTYIELKGGSLASPPLQGNPAEPYPEIATGPSLFNRLENALPDLLARFDSLLAQISASVEKVDSLLGVENRDRVADTLAHVEQITATLANGSGAITTTLDNLATASQHTVDATQRLPELTRTALAALESTRASLNEVSQAAGAVESMAGGIDSGMQHFSRGTLVRMDRALGELEGLIQTLERAARQVERDPGALVFGGREARPGPGER